MIKLDFTLQHSNDCTIKVIDTSQSCQFTGNYTIDSLVLLVSTKTKTVSFDVASYIIIYGKDRTFYELTGSNLGFGVNSKIPDDVYSVTLVLNNIPVCEKTFILYKDKLDRVNKLIHDTQYKTEVNTNDVRYIGDTVNENNKSKIEKIRLCVAFIDMLKSNSLKNDKEAAYITMGKLDRLLKQLKY